MFVSTSLNTEDFVNRVDQAHRLPVYRTTRPRRPCNICRCRNTEDQVALLTASTGDILAICALYYMVSTPQWPHALLQIYTARKLNPSSNSD